MQGEPTFIAEEAFASPAGEHLFGSGEFQDGYSSHSGPSPPAHAGELSQIPTPFLSSSKGYGILLQTASMV